MLVDKKAKRYERLLKLQDEQVTIGVHQEEGSEEHPNAEQGETIAEVADNNEFGLGVPRRSWLRDWVDSPDFHAAFRAGAAAVTSIEEFAEPIRLDLEYSIVSRMESGKIAPKNAPFTIKKKGHDRTLFETGALIKAVKAKRRKK